MGLVGGFGGWLGDVGGWLVKWAGESLVSLVCGVGSGLAGPGWVGDADGVGGGWDGVGQARWPATNQAPGPTLTKRATTVKCKITTHLPGLAFQAHFADGILCLPLAVFANGPFFYFPIIQSPSITELMLPGFDLIWHLRLDAFESQQCQSQCLLPSHGGR